MQTEVNKELINKIAVRIKEISGETPTFHQLLENGVAFNANRRLDRWQLEKIEELEQEFGVDIRTFFEST